MKYSHCGVYQNEEEIFGELPKPEFGIFAEKLDFDLNSKTFY